MSQAQEDGSVLGWHSCPFELLAGKLHSQSESENCSLCEVVENPGPGPGPGTAGGEAFHVRFDRAKTAWRYM